ncbi:hypothetical protein HII17_17750 [Thalassotalea sp. M1531]|uniref:Uncharacterized protein n=1 Tax=Thalassotalea algicola TaxID=2716224 RepID=A0A7Y0Q9N7_9GAMM|nr:hypothetical protein [Thalassotalea algicola]NMP33395.1 hypothetical protein [Thalassotalea algicola]
MTIKKAQLPGRSPERVFMATIENIHEAAVNTEFKGVVDVGVNFNAVEMSESGKLVSWFKGSKKQTSTVQIKLATRVHIE